MTKKWGFTGKVVDHEPGLYLRIPGNTAKSMELNDQELLGLELRNNEGKTVEVSRKVMESSNQYEIYLTKNTKEQLELNHKELVDVFLHKK